MSEIEAFDAAGSPIHIGDLVLYSSTGTKGKITEIISDDEGTWALVDRTNLYYKVEILKMIKTADEKELVEKKVSLEELSNTLEKQKEYAPAGMDHNNVESGG